MADMNIVIAAQTGAAQSEIARLQAKLKSLDGTVKGSTGTANQYGKVVDQNTRGLSRFAKSGLQQTGYQLGDFAVQVGGGTSALQAFGQQGSQLLGIFGATGALLGAGVAIVAALGNAYMKSGAMAKGFNEEMDDLNKLVSESHALGRTSAEQFAFLATKYGEVTESVKGLFLAEKSLLQLKLAETYAKAKQGLTPFVSELERANLVNRKAGQIGLKFGGSMAAMRGGLDDLAISTGLSVDQLEAFAAAMPKLMDMTDAKESIDFVNNLLETTGLQGVEAMSKLTKAGKENVQMLIEYGQAGRIVDITLEGLQKTVSEVEMATTGLGATFGTTLTDGNKMASGIATSMGSAFSSIIMGTSRTADAFKNMAGQIVAQLMQVLVIQRLVGVVGSTSPSGAVTPGTGLAGILSGTRAMGGQVTGGQSYLVGERGPELFSPSASGTIIPNGKMGGQGIVVNNNLTINSDNAAAVRSQVLSMLPMIKEASKGAVLEASRRGGSFANSFGN